MMILRALAARFNCSKVNSKLNEVRKGRTRGLHNSRIRVRAPKFELALPGTGKRRSDPAQKPIRGLRIAILMSTSVNGYLLMIDFLLMLYMIMRHMADLPCAVASLQYALWRRS